MKYKIFAKLFVVIFVIGILFAGCIRINPAQKFADGIVDLLMLPIEELRDDAYTKDLKGELQELINTRSHESEMTFKLDDLSAPEYFDTNLLDGAELGIDTQYDIESGNMGVEISGLGLINANFYLEEDDFTIDITQFLDSMIVYELDTQLDFRKTIELDDRISDLRLAFSPNADNMDSELVEDMRVILQNYAGILADNININNLQFTTEKIDILTKTKKCQVITVNFDEDDLFDLAEIMLEEAQDDDQLKDFIIQNFMMYEYEDERDAEDDFEEAIDQILDELEYLFEDMGKIDLSFSIYFKPSFIWSSEAPIALEIVYEDDYSETEIFYKFAKDDRERDIEFIAEADGEDIEFTFTSLKDGGDYEIEGELDFPSMDMSGDISGTIEVEKNSEISDVEISLEIENYDEEINAEVQIINELIQIKKGSEYEMVSEIELSMDYGGEQLSARVEIEGTYDFAESVDVDFPDSDDEVVRVDDLEELIEEFQYLIKYGF